MSSMRSTRALALGVLLLTGCTNVYVVRSRPLALPPIVFPIDTITYPSGLRVLAERDSRTPLVGLFWVVGSGQTSDPIGKEGLAHFVEHLAYRSRPGGGPTVREALEGLGAIQMNAMTSHDSTTFYEVGLARDLRELLAVQGRWMADPFAGVSDGELATEREIVANEGHLYDENGHPAAAMSLLFRSLFPAGHPYARDLTSYLPTLGGIGAEDARQFVAAHYRPENMTLLVLGDIDPDAVDKLIGETFPRSMLKTATPVKPGPRMPPAAPPVPEPSPAPAATPVVTAPVNAPGLLLAWTLPRSFGINQQLLPFVSSVVRGALLSAARDDADVLDAEVSVVPGAEASVLTAAITLREGKDPEHTLKKLLEGFDQLWDASRFFSGEVLFHMRKQVAMLGEVERAENLISRGLSRVSSAHFTGSATADAQVIPALNQMRFRDVSDFASRYVTAARVRAVLVKPEGAPQAPAAEEGEARAERQPGLEPSVESTGPATAATASPERLRALIATREREVYQLPNGLTVVLSPHRSLATVAAGILFPLTTPSPGDAVAAAMFGSVASPQGLRNTPDFGASVSRQLGWDSLSLRIESSVANLDQALALLAEYARRSEVSRSTWSFVQEKGVAQFETLEQQPAAQEALALRTALLGGTGYASVMSSATLRAADRSQVNRWIEQRASPSSAVLVVAGSFESARVKEMIALAFGRWAAPKPEADAAPESTAAAAAPAEGPLEIRTFERSNVSQTSVHLGCRLPDAHADTDVLRHAAAAAVLRNRMMSQLREQAGAVYDFSASQFVLRGGVSALRASSAVDNRALPEALRLLRASLAGLAATPPSEGELARARLDLAGTVALTRMSEWGALDELLGLWRLDLLGDAAPADDLLALTPASLQEDFAYCLAHAPRLDLIGDPAAMEAAERALREAPAH